MAAEGGSVQHCNLVRQCVVGTAFRLHFPLVDGRPPDGRLPDSHHPHEGSNVRYNTHG